MKKILFCLILVFSCGEGLREEVLHRYSNGNKRTVVTYQGKGKSEKVVNRIEYYENGNIEEEELFESNNKTEKKYYQDGNVKSVSKYSSDNKLIFKEKYYSNSMLARKFHDDKDIYYDSDGTKFSNGKNSYLTERLIATYPYNSFRRGIMMGLMERWGMNIDYNKKVVVYNKLVLDYNRADINNNIKDIKFEIIFNEIKLLAKFPISFDELITEIPELEYTLDGGRRYKKKIKISKEDIKSFANDCVNVYIKKNIHKN